MDRNSEKVLADQFEFKKKEPEDLEKTFDNGSWKKDRNIGKRRK